MTQHLELDFPIPYNTNQFKVGEIEEKKEEEIFDEAGQQETDQGGAKAQA